MATVNESSSISVLDDLEIVYVARVPTRRIMSITLSVGTRLPAYPTSMGRVLLAALDDEELGARLARIDIQPLSARTVTDKATLRVLLERVRKQGYAATDQELEEGLRSLAVPMHDQSGAVIAALNVSVHASRASMATLRREFLPEALKAAGGDRERSGRLGERAGVRGYGRSGWAPGRSGWNGWQAPASTALLGKGGWPGAQTARTRSLHRGLCNLMPTGDA